MTERGAAGKVVLVTGAASGIGRATSLLLARRGERVCVSDVDLAGAAVVAEEIARAGSEAFAVKLDVTLEADWLAGIESIVARWRGLDILVACAGISFARLTTEMTLEEWRRVMAVNLDGVFLGIKHAARAMRDAGRGGSIVVVSSVSGIKAQPGAAAYAASKAALRGLARAAALEFGAWRPPIRINTVLPGPVRTPMWRAMEFWPKMVAEHGSEQAAFEAIGRGVPLGRVAEPEDVARTIDYLASDQAAYITGAEIVVDGGFTA